MGAFVSIFTSLVAFSAAGNISTTICDGYDFLVTLDLLEPQENVRNSLSGVRRLADLLKICLRTLRELNEDLSGKVETALVSLEYLEMILKQHRDDCGLREIQKIKEIHSELKKALNSIKLQPANNRNSWLIEKFQVQLKRWMEISQTKQQLEEIKAKIKEAVQKGIELTTLSTSVTASKLYTLQQFNTLGTWPVTNSVTAPPTPPLLHVKELGNKFMLSWEKNDDDENINFFELCYDEDQSLSMPLDGNMLKTEIGSPKVVPGRIFTMKIRGINEGGEGKWSNSVVAQFTKPTPCKPDSPEVQMVDTSTVALTVAPPKQSHENESSVTEWNIQYVVDGQDREWTTENRKVNPGRGECKFNVENLIPNQKYHFRVQAVNTEGESDFSRPVSIKTEYIPSLDSPIIKAIGTSTAEVTIKSLEWSQPIVELKLQYTCDPPEPITYKGEPEDNMYTFVLQDLIPNRNYNVQLLAVHAGGYSSSSPVVSFQTASMQAPSFATCLSQLVLVLPAMFIPLLLYYTVPVLLHYLIVCIKYASPFVLVIIVMVVMFYLISREHQHWLIQLNESYHNFVTLLMATYCT